MDDQSSAPVVFGDDRRVFVARFSAFDHSMPATHFRVFHVAEASASDAFVGSKGHIG